jgi:hypothetical protein
VQRRQRERQRGITFVAGEHCYGGDPGNSYNAGNRGGDEIPTSGGVLNPGGNSVP